MKCAECRMNYCYDVRQDIREHETKHAKFLAAKTKFGFMYHHDQREQIKREIDQVIQDGNKNTEEKMAAYEKMFKVYFARSFEASDFSDHHPNLATYIAMLLNQDNWVRILTPEFHSFFVAQYGKLPGIAEGKSYFVVK